MFDYPRLRDCLESDLAAYPDVPLTSDLEVEEVRAIMLRRSFYKKLCPDGTLTEDQIKKATEKFLSTNDRIGLLEEFSAESDQEAWFYSLFRDWMDRAFDPGEVDLSLENLREVFAVGPGASVGADSESFYTKLFLSTLTATSPHLLTLYRGLVCESDAWSLAEMQRFRKFGFRLVSGNTLFFVPKDVTTARSCCTEPSINMMLQKALGGLFERRLEDCFGIRLSDQQDRNKTLALVGSKYNGFTTMDLESASDSISWAQLQKWLRGRTLGLVREARSPNTRLPGGQEVELKMVSTMGNGFTFPLMTIIFCCAVKATYDVMGLRSDARKLDYAVFGDDIIVRREAAQFLSRMLGKLGFRVNDAKSFFEGGFRESCGGDYWYGHSVRGVYVKTLETQSSVYSVINRLTRWSALSGISLERTLSFLISSIRGRLLRVPRAESWDSGLHVPFLLSRSSKVDAAYWFPYRKLTPRLPRRILPMTEDESLKHGYATFNAYGAEVTYLGGYARTSDRSIMSDDVDPGGGIHPFRPDAFLMLRSEDRSVRYRVRTSSTPWWDWEGGHDCPFKAAGMSQDAWVSVMTAVLK